MSWRLYVPCELLADEEFFRHFGAVECRNSKGFWCCSLRSSHFSWRHTSRGAENGAVLTVYANRFTRKGARSVCKMLTRQASSRMRIADQPGLQKPPSPGLTSGLPRISAGLSTRRITKVIAAARLRRTSRWAWRGRADNALVGLKRRPAQAMPISPPSSAISQNILVNAYESLGD
jgi:hypothetical protein